MADMKAPVNATTTVSTDLAKEQALASADRNAALKENKSGAFGWLRSLGDKANSAIDKAGDFLGGDGLIGKAIDKVGDGVAGVTGGVAAAGNTAVNVAAATVDKAQDLAVGAAKATVSAAKATGAAIQVAAKETAEFAVDGAKAAVWAAGEVKEAVQKFPELATNFAGAQIRKAGESVSGLVSEASVALGGEGLIGRAGVSYARGIKAGFNGWASVVEKTDDVARAVVGLPGEIAGTVIEKYGEAHAALIKGVSGLQAKALDVAGFSAAALANQVDGIAGSYAKNVKAIGDYLVGGGFMDNFFEMNANANLKAAGIVSGLLREFDKKADQLAKTSQKISNATAGVIEEKSEKVADLARDII